MSSIAPWVILAVFLFLLAVCIVAVLVQRCHARGLIGSTRPVGVPGATVRVRSPSPILPVTMPFDSDDLIGFRISHSTETCGICLESLEDSEVSAGACSHMFHTSCVANWLAKDPKRSCPMCREPFLGPDDPALRAGGCVVAPEAAVPLPMAVSGQAQAQTNSHDTPEIYTRHAIRVGHRTYPAYAFVAHAPQTSPRLSPSSGVAAPRLLAVSHRRRQRVFVF